METDESLYIKILIWAYYRQEKGFSWGDLTKEFNLTSEQELWVQKIFRSNMPASDNLFDHLSYNRDKDSHLFVITSKGTSAAIDYLNLKEAEKSGRRAERIAIAAIVIGIIVGVAEILIQLFSK
jgi:hypothetical protein